MSWKGSKRGKIYLLLSKHFNVHVISNFVIQMAELNSNSFYDFVGCEHVILASMSFRKFILLRGLSQDPENDFYYLYTQLLFQNLGFCGWMFRYLSLQK
jgi:hypothetical protein